MDRLNQVLHVDTVFTEAKKIEKAMTSHEKALEWQELFDLAQLSNISEEDLIAMAYRVAGNEIIFFYKYVGWPWYLKEELSSKKRYTEAGRVLLDYAQDVREGVIALVQGNAFSEARRIVCSIFLLFTSSMTQHCL